MSRSVTPPQELEVTGVLIGQRRAGVVSWRHRMERAPRTNGRRTRRQASRSYAWTVRALNVEKDKMPEWGLTHNLIDGLFETPRRCMGAKTWMLVYADGNARDLLAAKPTVTNQSMTC